MVANVILKGIVMVSERIADEFTLVTVFWGAGGGFQRILGIDLKCMEWEW